MMTHHLLTTKWKQMIQFLVKGWDSFQMSHLYIQIKLGTWYQNTIIHVDDVTETLQTKLTIQITFQNVIVLPVTMISQWGYQHNLPLDSPQLSLMNPLLDFHQYFLFVSPEAHYIEWQKLEFNIEKSPR